MNAWAGRLLRAWWVLPEGLRWIVLFALLLGTGVLTFALRWGELPATPFYPVVLLAVALGTEAQGYLVTALAVLASISLSLILHVPAEISQETMDSAVLALVGASLIVALHQRRSAERLMRAAAYETGVLRALGNYALTRLSREEMQRTVVRYLANSTDADSALLLMADAGGETLIGYADGNGRGPVALERPVQGSLAGEVFASGAARMVDSTEDLHEQAPDYVQWGTIPVGSLIMVPLRLAGQPIGVLAVGKEAKAAFNPEDVRLVETLARALAVPLYVSRPARVAGTRR
jgi:K+-sensing histidine kinase KdpD